MRLARPPAWIRQLGIEVRTPATFVAVILADPRSMRRGLRMARRLRGDRRHLVVVGSPELRSSRHGVTLRGVRGNTGLHRTLVGLGPVDLLVDVRPTSGEEQYRQWRRLFLHVGRGGTYVIPRSAIASGADRLMERLESLTGANGSSKPQKRAAKEIAKAVAAVRSGGSAIGVVRRGSHLLKLREKGVARLVNQRHSEGRVSVIDRRPGGVLRSERLHTSSPVGHARLLDDLPYPPAELRKYEGATDLYGGVVAVHGDVVLPESFKWHLAPQLSNNRLADVGGRWARFRDVPDDPTPLDGAYYYLDYKNIGHYGHLLVEALPKLWGWDAAKEALPGLKLLRRKPSRKLVWDPTDELLAAFGIDESDVVTVAGPVRVQTLVGATPMLHATTPYHAHPDVTQVWSRVRRGLLRGHAASPGPRRIFVTRHRGKRLCRNVEAVDQLFVDHGFEVVFPERLSLAGQAALFDGADVVAGFGGTGLFNLIYASGAPTVIVLNHDAYDVRNEHIIAAALGSDIHYFWSPADIRPATGASSVEAFKSSWSFDFESNGDALLRLLKDLGRND